MMPGTAAMTHDEIAHLFDRRLDALKRRDVEALACDYAEDAVIDSPVGSVRGRAGIETLHRGWFGSFPDLTFEGVSGVYGWRGMPAEIRQRVVTDVSAIVADPEFRARALKVGTVPRTGTPEEFAAAIEAQRAQVAAIHAATAKPRP